MASWIEVRRLEHGHWLAAPKLLRPAELEHVPRLFGGGLYLFLERDEREGEPGRIVRTWERRFAGPALSLDLDERHEAAA